MDKTCLACGHLNPAANGASDSACPQCGAIYAKLEARDRRFAAPGQSDSQSAPSATAVEAWGLQTPSPLKRPWWIIPAWGVSIAVAAIVVLGTPRSAPRGEHSLPSACAAADAKQLDQNLRVMSKWDESDAELISVTVRREYWELMKDDQEKQDEFVRAVANTDVCVTGRARYIEVFGADGRALGYASPESGVKTYGDYARDRERTSGAD